MIPTDQNKVSSTDQKKLMRLWMARPEVFFKNVLGWEPWEKQVEILHSIRDNRETMVQSCNAAGKSWLAAGIVIWWMITRFNGKVITTAPTWRQVQDVLWAKIGSQAAKAPVLGLKPMQTAMNMDKDWFARGLSTRQPEKFAGYHGNVLMVVDEASGVVGEGLWAAMDGNLTDFKNDRMLAIRKPY
jgi:tRNA(Met) C34 N-acetyltransferase TmcA